MTKLEQLIEQLCPDGVEYKMLGEIGNVSMCKRILKHETSEIGDVPFYKIGTFGKEANAFISFETYEKYKRLYSFPKKGEVLISASGTIGRTVIFDGEPAYFQDSNIVWISNDETHVTNRFLYYFYQTKPWQVSSGGTIARLYNDNILRTKIPVPPLEVQAEIVRILDTFTELTTELTTELANRKKQYEYYRNSLLSFSTIVKKCRISDVCEISRGKVISKDDIRNNAGGYPVYSSQTENNGELGKISSYMYDGEYLTWTTDGANAGSIFYRSGKFNITNVCGLLKVDTKNVDIRYLFHALTVEAPKYVRSGMGNPKLMSNVMGSIKISFPELPIQRRIARVLDNFEAICSDLNIGLPAEIKARQKQYEYYRDKLLTFKEK